MAPRARRSGGGNGRESSICQPKSGGSIRSRKAARCGPERVNAPRLTSVPDQDQARAAAARGTRPSLSRFRRSAPGSGGGSKAFDRESVSTIDILQLGGRKLRRAAVENHAALAQADNARGKS